MFNITIQNNKTLFKCREDQTLLSAAQENRVNLPFSCENGRCKSCRIEILQGDIQKTNSNNETLACATYPKSNLVIDAEILENLPLVNNFPVKVYKIEYLSVDIIRIKFKYPKKQNLQINQGQHINLSFKRCTRKYSLETFDPIEKTFSLIIKLLETGEMSNLIKQDIQLGTLMFVEGPLGSFANNIYEVEKPILFLATGTGIAPIINIMQTIENRLHSKPLIVWGNRWRKDFFDIKIDQKIELIKVVSREHSDNEFDCGYVQEVAVKRIENDLSNYYVAACGLEKMVEHAKSLFCQNGLKLENFTSDIFYKSGRE